MTLNFVFITLEAALLHSILYEDRLKEEGQRFLHTMYLNVDSSNVGSSYTLEDE
jgi:hypothetical protein